MKYLDLNGLQSFFKLVKQKIPTKTSQIENDSGFLSRDALYSAGQWTPTLHTDNKKIETSFNAANYIKFDRICFVNFIIDFKIKEQEKLIIKVKGLPFKPFEDGNFPYIFTGSAATQGLDKSQDYLFDPPKNEIKVKLNPDVEISLIKGENISLKGSGVYLTD